MSKNINTKPGYKKTKIGWIPEKWDYTNLDSKIDLLSGFAFKSELYAEQGIKLLRGANIKRGNISWDQNIVRFWNSDISGLEKYFLNEGDLVIAMDGSLVGRSYGMISKADLPALLLQRVARIRSEKINVKFLNYLIGSSYFITYCNAVKTVTAIPHISAKDIKNFKIPLPPLPEQQKIAEILSTWDQAINQQQAILENCIKRNKGLAQQLLSGKKRLNGYTEEWKILKLKHYLEVSKEKNESNHYSKSDVLSVSGEFGIINQIEFQGRSFAGKSVANYGIVQKGDIVYTKSPLKSNPYGIIKVNKGNPGIVSTLYAIYKCKPTIIGEYIDYYYRLNDNVNRFLRPLVQKGSKNDMKINNEKVLEGKVLFPPKVEQKVMVDFFKTLDNEIEAQKNYLLKLQKQKKGLMQKLLTGEIRVNVNNN